METEAIVNGRAIPGELSTVVAGGTGAPRWVRSPCRGEELRHEPSLGAGDRIQVSLRFGSPSYESGWTILVDEDATNEETISLAGRALTPRIDCAALGALEGAGVLVLFACDGARADVRSRIVVFTEGATATAPVHVPLGRYLYRFGTAACHVAFHSRGGARRRGRHLDPCTPCTMVDAEHGRGHHRRRGRGGLARGPSGAAAFRTSERRAHPRAARGSLALSETERASSVAGAPDRSHQRLGSTCTSSTRARPPTASSSCSHFSLVPSPTRITHPPSAARVSA